LGGAPALVGDEQRPVGFALEEDAGFGDRVGDEVAESALDVPDAGQTPVQSAWVGKSPVFVFSGVMKLSTGG